MSREVPALPGHWLLGNLPAYRRDRLEFVREFMRTCGDVGRLRVGPLRFLAVGSPSLAHEILVSHKDDFDKGAFQRRAFAFLMGNGILSSDGEFHRRQRSMMAPFFTPREVLRYGDIMASDAQALCDAWSDDGEIDLDAEMLRLSTRTGGRALFSTDVAEDVDALGEAMAAGFHHVDEAMSSMRPMVPLSIPTAANRRLKSALALVQGRIQQMIDLRRSEPGEARDFLGMLIRARDEERNGMTDQQVMDEAVTLFLSGYETSAKALTWTLYLLARHPEYQCAIREELLAASGGGPLSTEQATRLRLPLRAFKESIRLYPPGSAVIRRAVRDVEVEGVRIPKGTMVLILIYGIHHREDLHPDPERFDPDRFLPENEKRLPPGAYLPFASGARVCIGNHFAMLHAQMVLTTVLREYSLELVTDAPVVPELRLTLRPKDPIRLRVRRISARAPAAAPEARAS